MSMIGNYLVVSPTELERLYLSPSYIAEFLYDIKKDEIVDIDKSWHAIHFTLNDSQWDGTVPLVNVVMGGKPIGEEDVGYEPARGLSSEVVKSTYLELKKIDESKFRAMFDVELLEKNEIYPSIWSEREDAIEYIADYYNVVVSIFKEATERECALIVFLN